MLRRWGVFEAVRDVRSGEAVCVFAPRVDTARVVCRCAPRFLGRIRGLLGTSPESTPRGDGPGRRKGAPVNALLLVPCASVHTYGMAYPLDIAWIDPAGLVLRSRRTVPPGRVLPYGRKSPFPSERPRRRPVAVLEREASSAPWFVPGETVALARLGAGAMPSR